jgi:hypothetical protein
MRILLFILTVAALLSLGASSARACPLCESETGERVRAGIFDADFGYNLFATVLPFSASLAIVTSIHYGWPWAKGRPGQITPLEAGVTKRP